MVAFIMAGVFCVLCAFVFAFIAYVLDKYEGRKETPILFFTFLCSCIFFFVSGIAFIVLSHNKNTLLKDIMCYTNKINVIELEYNTIISKESDAKLKAQYEILKEVQINIYQNKINSTKRVLEKEL